MMLIRSSLPSSNPVTLPDAVCIAFGPEAKTEKSRKFNDFSLFSSFFEQKIEDFLQNLIGNPSKITKKIKFSGFLVF